MRLRLAILGAEMRFVLLLGAELIFLNPAIIFLIAYFPAYLLLLSRFEGGTYVKPVGIFFLILLVAVIVRKIQLGSDIPAADLPVSKPLSNYPALQEIVRTVAAQLNCPPPKLLRLGLSPVPWQRLGVDLERPGRRGRAVPIPLCCLPVWSILDFQAHIARNILLRRGPAWLMKLIESAIDRLAAEQYQAHLTGNSHWLVRAQGKALQRYVDALGAWRFLVDLEADLKAARFVGVEAVMSSIYKTEIAKLWVPVCLSSLIEPAIDKRALLPIAESCAFYISAADPNCKDVVNRALKEIEQSPESGASPFVVRLAALSAMPMEVGAQDPRTASSLFADFRTLEREVAANEIGSRKIEQAKDVDADRAVDLVVMPQIKDEISRSFELLFGRDRFDIPALLRDKANLAAHYRPDYYHALPPAERQERIPYLLRAFLALELIQDQWVLSYKVSDGIHLCLGERKIQPFSLVDELDSDLISDKEFLAAIQ